MKYKTKVEILYKVIERVYTKDIYKEEGVPLEQVFLLFFAVGFFVFVCEGQLIFSGDQDENHVEFFHPKILRV